VPEPDVKIDTIRTIDDIFVRMVEADLGRQHLPLDDAVEEIWTLLESGGLRLVGEGDRLRVNPFKGPRLSGRSWPSSNGPSSRRGGACCAASTRLR
jgi:hypothetical protein